jgi:hypothetical protein
MQFSALGSEVGVGVAVGGEGVAVAVAGTGVGVGVAVAGTGVDVAVTGTGVDVGTGVFVACTTASGVGVARHPLASMAKANKRDRP